MASFEDLKPSYFIRDVHPDFATGFRKDLRYANSFTTVHLAKINPKGPDIFDYLQFAKNDISSGCQRGAINALGNAKRAVHLTIETFLRLLCLDKAHLRSNFPTKIKLLESLQAFPTGLIKRLNQKRNLVEHEYVDIGLTEVTDFVEVAEMFTLLTCHYLKSTVIGAYVGIEGDNRCLEWIINHKLSEIQINEVKGTSFLDTPVGHIHYNIKLEDTRNKVSAVKILKSNTNDWLPYVDLFVYCTKQKLIALPKDEDEYTGLVLSQSAEHIP